MKKLLLISMPFLLITSGLLVYRSTAQTSYVPTAQLCANGSKAPFLASAIGPDPLLHSGFGYSGLFGPLPTSPGNDLETPFDNMAWQMFVALNWVAAQLINHRRKV